MDEQHSKREANEYVRKGECQGVESLGGRRYVAASERRTRQNWAREIKSIVTEPYPQAETKLDPQNHTRYSR